MASWEELKRISESRFTAPPERQLPGLVERDPWKCQECGKLIYNLDKDGHPVAGAPLPKWGDPDRKEICTLCFQMKSVLETRLFVEIAVDPLYWKALQDKWKARQKDNDKLKPGEDYFAK